MKEHMDLLSVSRIEASQVNVIAQPFIALAALALLMQQFPIPSLDWQNITLQGALLAACIMLWRSNDKKDQANEKKDADIMELVRITTAALTSTTSLNQHISEILEDSVKCQRDLTGAINRLDGRIK